MSRNESFNKKNTNLESQTRHKRARRKPYRRRTPRNDRWSRHGRRRRSKRIRIPSHHEKNRNFLNTPHSTFKIQSNNFCRAIKKNSFILCYKNIYFSIFHIFVLLFSHPILFFISEQVAVFSQIKIFKKKFLKMLGWRYRGWRTFASCDRAVGGLSSFVFVTLTLLRRIAFVFLGSFACRSLVWALLCMRSKCSSDPSRPVGLIFGGARRRAVLQIETSETECLCFLFFDTCFI